MPPLRRSTRLRRIKEAVPEEDRDFTREKKRREIHHTRLSSADMNLPLKSSGIWSDDSQLQLDATTQLLNLVSLEQNPLIDEVVQSRAVPRLVEFLGRDDYPQLQLEAARVLKNITNGTYKNTQVVTKCGVIPAFVKLLGSSELETCEQVVWSLGNIAGESSRHCKIVLDCGGLHPLLSLLENHNNSLSFLRIGTWSLANILEKVRGSIVPFEQLELAVRVLASLTHSNDEAVLKEACWALLHLSNSGGGIGTMYEADLIPKLVSLIQHAPLSVVYPAIQASTSILRKTLKLDKVLPSVLQNWAARRSIIRCRSFNESSQQLSSIIKELNSHYL